MSYGLPFILVVVGKRIDVLKNSFRGGCGSKGVSEWGGVVRRDVGVGKVIQMIILVCISVIYRIYAG